MPKSKYVGSEDFDRFWAAYPKRVGRVDAMKAFQKLAPSAELLTVMLEALAWQTKTPMWTKEGGQFAPFPATWIRGRRWEDEPFHAPVTRLSEEDIWLCQHTPRCGNRTTCAIVAMRKPNHDEMAPRS